MNREDYITARNQQNDGWIMYQYYAEHFNNEKHSYFLPIEEFFKYIQMWEGLQQAANLTLAYYDAKFNTLKIPDKQGNILRYE